MGGGNSTEWLGDCLRLDLHTWRWEQARVWQYGEAAQSWVLWCYLATAARAALLVHMPCGMEGAAPAALSTPT